VAINFNGTCYTNHGNILNTLSAMTITAWFKVATTGLYGRIVSKEHPTGSVSGWYIGLNGANRVDFGLLSGGTYNITGNTDITPGVKHFVCAWYDGAHIRIFLDGADDAPGGGPSASGTASNTDPFCIGCQSFAFGSIFPGIIEDVRFYNRCLNEEGIRSLYQAQGGDRNVFGLQGRWKLNEGYSGQSTIHRIMDGGGGNAYNGYVVAAPTRGTYVDQLVRSRSTILSGD
jgi:hypothetical protein